MKTLVIGGSRFVGLHLVQELLRQGHEVTVFNRGQTPVEFPPGVKRLYGDRKDYDTVRSVLGTGDFDAVFDTSAYVREDVQPLPELFAGRIGHYVFTSTTAVYERSHIMPITEDFSLARRPGVNPYAANKIECEDYLRRAFEEKGFPATFVRPCMVYGPDNNIPQREASFFARFLQGRKIVVPGDGLTLIHFVHIGDLARLFTSVLERGSTIGEAYTGAGAEAITIDGYISTIADIVGVEPQIVHLPSEVAASLERRFFPYEWRWSIIYSIQKAREQLDFRPQYGMETGLRHSYEWYVSKGMEKTEFDFSYEDELIQRYG